MNLGTVLENEPSHSICNQKEIKILYLQKQKERLEELVLELQSNNGVLRNVVRSMATEKKDQNELLLRQNEKLENEKLLWFEKQEKVIAQSFLFEQINVENENQMRHISKNYEEKIIDLRRSVQAKEGSLQTYQNKKKILDSLEEIIIPPYSVSMHFYAEFQQYKETVEILIKKNKQLKNKNNSLNQILSKLQNKNSTYQALLKSKCSFLEYRNLANSDKPHSLPKKQVKMHNGVKKISLKNLQENAKNEYEPTTREISHYQEFNKLGTVKKMLKNQYLENQNLKNKVIYLSKKLSQEKQKCKKIIESNHFHIRKREQILDQLNYFKSVSKNLTQALLKRRHFPRSSSVHKETEMKQKSFITIEKQKIKPIDFEYWTTIQQQLNRKLADPIPHFIPKKKKQRSRSCVCDYFTREHAQNPQKMVSKQKNKKPKRREDSRVLESNFFQDISIIGGSQKKTYAEMKRQNKKEEEVDGNMILSDSLFE